MDFDVVILPWTPLFRPFRMKKLHVQIEFTCILKQKTYRLHILKQKINKTESPALISDVATYRETTRDASVFRCGTRQLRIHVEGREFESPASRAGNFFFLFFLVSFPGYWFLSTRSSLLEINLDFSTRILIFFHLILYITKQSQYCNALWVIS